MTIDNNPPKNYVDPAQALYNKSSKGTTKSTSGNDVKPVNSAVIDSDLDDAQKLYSGSAGNIEANDNNVWVSLGLAVASFIPFVNTLNFFMIYNIVSLVFAVRVLRKKSKTQSEKIVAIIAIILDVIAVALTISTILLLFLGFFFI